MGIMFDVSFWVLTDTVLIPKDKLLLMVFVLILSPLVYSLLKQTVVWLIPLIFPFLSLGLSFFWSLHLNLFIRYIVILCLNMIV